MSALDRAGRRGAAGDSDRSLIARLWGDDGGQDLVEYVFIILFVALAVVAGLKLLGGEVSKKYSATGASITSSG